MKRERGKEEGEDRRRWFSLIRGGSKKREWAFLDFLPSPGAGFFFLLPACLSFPFAPSTLLAFCDRFFLLSFQHYCIVFSAEFSVIYNDVKRFQV
jgi:hypothetical protein